jgi:chromosome segregation ATPase
MTEYGDMLAEWRKDARAFEARIAELERQLHDYQARVIPAETRVVALEAALLEIATECSTFPIKEGLAFRCDSIARAALEAKHPCDDGCQ